MKNLPTINLVSPYRKSNSHNAIFFHQQQIPTASYRRDWQHNYLAVEIYNYSTSC